MLVSLDLIYKLFKLVFLSLNTRELLPFLLLSSCHILIEQISLPGLLLNILAILIDNVLLLIKCLSNSLQGSLNIRPILNRVIQNDSDFRGFFHAYLVVLLSLVVLLFFLLILFPQ